MAELERRARAFRKQVNEFAEYAGVFLERWRLLKKQRRQLRTKSTRRSAECLEEILTALKL